MNKKVIFAGLSVAGFCLLFTQRAQAQAFQTIDRTWTFEDAPNSGWFFGGNAGYDVNRGFAHSGQSNVWINAWQPGTWNSVNVEFTPGVGSWGGNTTTCDITAWVQTSGNFRNGILDVWNIKNGALGAQLSETHIFADQSYQQVFATVDVSASSGTVLMDFGFWGTGSGQWIRVDDVNVTCWNFNR